MPDSPEDKEKKKGCMGCSLPLITGVTVVLLGFLGISFLSGALGTALFGEGAGPSFVSAPKPAPELPAEEIFHIFGFPITNCILASWVTIIALVGFAYAVTHRIKLVPSKLQGLLEMALEWMLNLCEDSAGRENARRFFPVVCTLFLFVIMNAWLSLIPGFGTIGFWESGEHGMVLVPFLRGTNTDINFPLALALISFGFVEYWGVTSVGLRTYLSKFFNFRRLFGGFAQLFRGKVRSATTTILNGCIDIFTGFLELISELVRIVSFTFRLFGNMTGGEILLLMVVFLVPWILPLPFYALELLVGFVQALIFGGLTLGFATIAVTPPHREG
jgi:F-type H+-transporting ATPase subunit a